MTGTAGAAVFERRPALAVWAATAFYFVFALFATWPLAAGLGRDVASDFGDPLLNMWILAWDCEQLRAILGGDFSRIATFFDANIFHPARLTLAYSEHLFPQAVQVLPVYLLTRNPILCYNLLFLSTYVLSGAGAFLLVRELTRDWRAAFIGGLLFAFALYRVPQASHLQVVSAQWMPFALYGLTRYLDTRRWRPLAGGTLALVLQALSCGYYLLYFVPFAIAYVLWEMGRRRLFRDRRLWRDLIVAAVIGGALITPFLLPYAGLREQGRFARGLTEVEGYSADVYSYLTASTAQNVWGGAMEMFQRSEGELFQGAVPMLLGIIAFAIWGARAWSSANGRPAGRYPAIAVVLGAAAALCLAMALIAIFQRRINLDVGLFVLRVYNVTRVLLWGAGLLAAVLAISPRARARFRGLMTVEGFFCASIAVAWWLSLGPQPRVLGRTLEMASLYRLLYDVVPGFDGVRVPARYAMVVAFLLAIAAALAAATLLRKWPRAAAAGLAVLSIAFLFEAPARRFPINGAADSRAYRSPEPRVYRPGRAPGVYRRLAALNGRAVLLELPIGDTNWDLRSVYYSTVHWARVVNGYSGFFPPSYGFLVLALTDPARTGDISWQALESAGVTHVIVHERAYLGAEPLQIRSWLLARGAHELSRDGSDVLYVVRQRRLQ